MPGRSRFRGLIRSKLGFTLLVSIASAGIIGKGSGLTALSIPALGPPGPPLRGKDGAFRANEVIRDTIPIRCARHLRRLVRRLFSVADTYVLLLHGHCLKALRPQGSWYWTACPY